MKISRHKEHNYSLDLLRILGAFGIVWFHAPGGVPGKNIGYSGLVIFIVVSIALMIPRIPSPGFVAKRAKRLLVPWLFWYFVYGTLNVITGNSFLPAGISPIDAILSGPKFHLWYLPFLFFTSISIYYLIRLLKELEGLKAVILYASLTLFLLFTTGLWRSWSMGLGPPWSQWTHALPAVFIGASIGYISGTNSGKKSAIFLLLFSFIVSCVSLLIIHIGYKGVGVPYLIGTALTGIAFIYNLPRSDILADISGLSFGIYLTHPLIYLLVIKFMKIQLPPTGYIITLVFILSGLLTMCIKKTPLRLTKWIV